MDSSDLIKCQSADDNQQHLNKYLFGKMKEALANYEFGNIKGASYTEAMKALQYTMSCLGDVKLNL